MSPGACKPSRTYALDSGKGIRIGLGWALSPASASQVPLVPVSGSLDTDKRSSDGFFLSRLSVWQQTQVDVNQKDSATFHFRD